MGIFGKLGYKRVDYWDLGVGVRGKNLRPLFEPRFDHAHLIASQRSSGTVDRKKDMRWRAHNAIWAASIGMELEGDFVECGVANGFLSHAICDYLCFSKVNKKFFLFDTFQGIPINQATPPEQERARQINIRAAYSDSFEHVKNQFSIYPNVVPVRGVLPESLDDVEIDKIAYLSIDLNVASAEIGVVEKLWERISKGAVVLIDDYAWSEHADQMTAWDAFAKRNNKLIGTSPVGQGFLVR